MNFKRKISKSIQQKLMATHDWEAIVPLRGPVYHPWGREMICTKCTTTYWEKLSQPKLTCCDALNNKIIRDIIT